MKEKLTFGRLCQRCPVRVIILFLFITISSTIVKGQAITSDKPHQYKITSWTTDDGLPTNAFVDIFQDEEGYLWFGSFEGIIRFDGTQFVTITKAIA